MLTVNCEHWVSLGTSGQSEKGRWSGWVEPPLGKWSCRYDQEYLLGSTEGGKKAKKVYITTKNGKKRFLSKVRIGTISS